MSSDKYHCGYRVCSQIPIITEDLKNSNFLATLDAAGIISLEIDLNLKFSIQNIFM